MQAFLTRSLTGLNALALGDAEPPQPGPGEIVVTLEAAGVNLADLAFAMGQRAPKPALPFIPGMEGAGTVTAIGKGVKAVRKGDAVAAFLASGGIAQSVKTSVALTCVLPKGVTAATGASLPHNYAGALMALRDRAALKAGEILLVLGAGGTAGLAAISIGKAMGAKVFAVANGAERRNVAKEQGADEVIDPGNAPVAEELLKLTGDKRADVIFDPVSGDAAIAGFPAGANGMRYIMAGFAGGSVPRLELTQLFARDAVLIAANTPLMVEREPERAKKALADVIAWAAAGKIKPRVAAKFPLAEARHAFDYVAGRRGMGAVLVTMS
jgi:NADPH2:quinone reductase